jgi:hypothetical protein
MRQLCRVETNSLPNAAAAGCHDRFHVMWDILYDCMTKDVKSRTNMLLSENYIKQNPSAQHHKMQLAEKIWVIC